MVPDSPANPETARLQTNKNNSYLVVFPKCNIVQKISLEHNYRQYNLTYHLQEIISQNLFLRRASPPNPPS